MSKSVLLACSVGGLKATAIAAGTFYALQDCGYTVLGMTGSSGGSIALPLLGQNLPASTVSRTIGSVNPDKLVDLDLTQRVIDAIRNKIIGKRKGYKPFTGAIQGKGIYKELQRIYSDKNCTMIENSKIPYGVAASILAPEKSTEDSDSYNEMLFRSGQSASAVRASISIPGVFQTYDVAGIGQLVDGGLVDSIPAESAINAFGPYDVIIADATNDVFENTKFDDDITNLFSALTAAIYVAVKDSTQQRLKQAKDKLLRYGKKLIRVAPTNIKIKMFEPQNFPDAFAEAYTQAKLIIQNGGQEV